MSFRLVLPKRRAAPVVVEVPHAGVQIPASIAAELDCTPRDVLRDSDTYVDELVAQTPDTGATLLVSDVSRYVVDLNRTERDIDALSVPSLVGARCPHGAAGVCDHAPRGVIWRESTEGYNLLRQPLSEIAYRSRIDQYYAPYHRALAARLSELHAMHGFVMLVSVHSMPGYGRGPDGSRVRRADIVPGTRGQTTAHRDVIHVVDSHFRAAGLSVRHDDPYRGGATTARWGRVSDGFHAVQIELNRALYLDESSLHRRRDGQRWLQQLCFELIERLTHVDTRSVLSARS
ncbi:MAG: N-formylglutamate amidohydrolase [Deltaproteobacteria bacterium]|nr:N-formylglutamate amidohydrolase [Deltaproteobacteria bacterium]